MSNRTLLHSLVPVYFIPMRCIEMLRKLFQFVSVSFLAVAVCGGNYAGSLNGNLSTPNFPQNYPDSSNCVWIIHCPFQHSVLVSIPMLSIEEDKTCAFDYLVFYDGSSTRSVELSARGSVAGLKQNKVCGTRYKMSWKSTGRSITTKFKSDDSTSEKGFSGTWACVPSPGEPTLENNTCFLCTYLQLIQLWFSFPRQK